MLFSRPSKALTVALVAWATSAYVIPYEHTANDTSLARDDAAAILLGRSQSPNDFSWIKKWAAIGDSFTAGIGSGQQLGDWMTDDWKCSRYSYSWPMIVNHALGSSVSTFDFKACSGDRTGGIYNQANALSDGPYDVVMMTAGGNDLCLASMIKNCVFLPYYGMSTCTEVIDKAQENIENILKGNVKDILYALNDKMSKGSILVYNGYAPFFNTENEDCATNEAWAIRAWWLWSYWTSSPLQLSVSLREQFNALVVNINSALADVIDEINNDSSINYKAVFSDWSQWPGAEDGQFCSPNSNGYYPDSNQPNLMFFKRNTHKYSSPHDELKRDVDGVPDVEVPGRPANLPEEAREKFREDMAAALGEPDDIYESILWKSPNPGAVARRKLEGRGAPAAANCPGDSNPDLTLGLGGPDSFLRNFHPNEMGHEGIAAFSLENLIYERAKMLGVKDSICELTDVFTCYGKQGSKAYLSWELLNDNYKSFCNGVKAPDNTVNWRYDKTYYSGTPSEVQFSVRLDNGASKFDEAQCVSAMNRIINSCDGNEPNNPMNWKFGGSYQLGSYTYDITPKKNRPMPEFTRTNGDCQGWYKVFFSSYTLHGKGWADYDFGQKTLLPAARKCVGGGITDWQFSYYDDPASHNGWEWTASFHTPIWVKARCFSNLKVQKAAGGYTMKYNQDFAKEQYSDYGCSGNDA